MATIGYEGPAPRTMYDKIWEDHTIENSDGTFLIFIDRHLVHEASDLQLFMHFLHHFTIPRLRDCL